ncbi:NH(3)-dependent NAD(+) synthetase [Desulfacinum hydrothermale DSM 13146]|uniref:Glutamine-dependent NAD(+) synthetase n=1 Tax=Desulfacinum hydrothermale DSM 13146 TaxID=1121390 RepID=A0A1W1XV06_9BACT|nr:NAD+ synthase [Desulfacinum hydrothermale]SMC27736.1 NH(3)-dependent NAD(+) synthetase [Desulfacinum hydrothermale DSM 13146]
MKIALIQMNATVGDFAGNAAKIRQGVQAARSRGADLAVFPEMALVGYPPRDLLDRRGFVDKSLRYWDEIAETSRGMAVLCGAVVPNPEPYGKPFHNAALWFEDGSLRHMVHKRLLPSYDVFDEERYFEPGGEPGVVTYRQKRIGVSVCEDVWTRPDYLPRPLYRVDPVLDLHAAGMEILINIAASPYHVGKAPWVGGLLRDHALRFSVPVIYVNQVGGNDELIFQGHSMAWGADGALLACGADFKEDVVLLDLEDPRPISQPPPEEATAEVLEALVLGLRDYAEKCGFRDVVLGLSGGIDSAVVACIARLALGAEHVMAVALPGPYNAPESLEDARELAARLGVSFAVVPIHNLFRSAREALQPLFGDRKPDVTEENIQARLRGLLLMALSNKFERLVLNTGNKSELAVGYCTLYGDMNGGLSVLGDVPKTLVYRLANHINQRYGWIPKRIIARPPSAELRPDQKDQDSLPPYPLLDAILTAYVEERRSFEEICSEGHDPEVVRWVLRRVNGNEYKRWQAPPVLRVTTKAFGSGRRCPIAHRYREE